MSEQTKQIQKFLPLYLEEKLRSRGYHFNLEGEDINIELFGILGRIRVDSGIEIYYQKRVDTFFDQLECYTKDVLELRQILDENHIPYREIPSRGEFLKKLRGQAEAYKGLADLVENSQSQGGSAQ